jgi:hypothetical protein
VPPIPHKRKSKIYLYLHKRRRFILKWNQKNLKQKQRN